MTETSRLFAIQGAAPAFREPIHVGRPNQPPREAFLRRLNEALDRNWLSNNGPLVKEFEEKIGAVTSVPHCVAVSNGTSGLQVLMRALGIAGPIAMPSFTFVATPASAAWLGLDPMLVDIEGERYGLCPEQVASLPAIDGIVGVHVWGIPCAVEELALIAAERGCPLILDSAHALGSRLRGVPIGGFGAAEVFSFHATKLVHSFEGGAVTTNDESLADEVRRMINFGFVGYDEVSGIGTNSKMSELNAAMGLATIEFLPNILEHNAANRAVYEASFSSIPGIELVTAPSNSQTNEHYVVALIDEDKLGLSRDGLYRLLHSENVLARRYFYPGTHRMGPYQRFAGERSFVISDAISHACLAFPTGLAVDEHVIRRIAELIERCHTHHKLVSSLVAETAAP